MATLYPLSIDTSITLPSAVDKATPVEAVVVNRLRDAIIAIESELGVKPSGIYGTVRNRLDVLENLYEHISDAQVSSSAAIAGTKISPNFGAQNISTTGTGSFGATTATALNLQTKTVTAATYTIDASEADFFILCNRSGVITLTLPAPTAGRYLIVKDISGAAATPANNITVNPHIAEAIDGASSFTIDINYGSIGLESDGTNWWIV